MSTRYVAKRYIIRSAAMEQVSQWCVWDTAGQIRVGELLRTEQDAIDEAARRNRIDRLQTDEEILDRIAAVLREDGASAGDQVDEITRLVRPTGRDVDAPDEYEDEEEPARDPIAAGRTEWIVASQAQLAGTDDLAAVGYPTEYYGPS